MLFCSRKKIAPLIISILCLLFFTGCFSGSDSNNDEVLLSDGTRIGNPGGISGYIQKGPFISGTSVTIQELSENDLTPTGLFYEVQTTDDLGSFSLPGEVESPYVEIKAEGFYYNENITTLTDSPLSLRAVANVSEDDNMNVNVLTTLAKKRIMYLFNNQGEPFAEAKAIAEAEVLRAFNIPDEYIAETNGFENMDISRASDSDAILLAISVILQAPGSEMYPSRTVAELSQLIDHLGRDLEADGQLDEPRNIQELEASVRILDRHWFQSIRTHLEAYYESLGVAVTVPPFENFIDNYDLLYPTGNITKNEITLDWTDYTGPKNNIKYAVLLSSDENFNDIIEQKENLSESSYTISANLLLGKEYFWQVFIIGENEIWHNFAGIERFIPDAYAPIFVTSECPESTYGYAPISVNSYCPLPAGTYNHDIVVELYSETDGVTIYYTVDGSEPTDSSLIYIDPLEISGDQTEITIKAVAVKDKIEDFDPVISYYKIDYDYDPGQYIHDLSYDDYASAIVGTWVGHVTPLHGNPYNIFISFNGENSFANGSYTGQSLSQWYNYALGNYEESWMPVFYDGGGGYLSNQYSIDSVTLDDGKASGSIQFLYELNKTDEGKMEQISFGNSLNNLEFDLLLPNRTEPLGYKLTRFDND